MSVETTMHDPLEQFVRMATPHVSAELQPYIPLVLAKLQRDPTLNFQKLAEEQGLSFLKFCRKIGETWRALYETSVSFDSTEIHRTEMQKLFRHPDCRENFLTTEEVLARLTQLDAA